MADWLYSIHQFHRQRAIATPAISLALTYLLAPVPSVLAKPTPAPIFRDITLSPNFSPDPQSVRGIGGGSIPVKTVAKTETTPTGACMGFVDRQPNRKVVLKSFFNYLKIEVQSLEDTTLLIKGPGGIWCNDDYQGKNPGVAGQWLEGDYQIWVGSYTKGQYIPYAIKFSQKP